MTNILKYQIVKSQIHNFNKKDLKPMPIFFVTFTLIKIPIVLMSLLCYQPVKAKIMHVVDKKKNRRSEKIKLLTGTSGEISGDVASTAKTKSFISGDVELREQTRSGVDCT